MVGGNHSDSNNFSLPFYSKWFLRTTSSEIRQSWSTISIIWFLQTICPIQTVMINHYPCMVYYNHSSQTSDGDGPPLLLYSFYRPFPQSSDSHDQPLSLFGLLQPFLSEVRQWWPTISPVWFLQTISSRADTVLVNHSPRIFFQTISESGWCLFTIYV